MELDETTFRLIGALGILFAGFIISKIGSQIINSFQMKKRSLSKKSPLSKLFNNIISTISVVTTLFFLKVKLGEDFFVNAYNMIPDILSFILLIILIFIIVNTIMNLLEKIIDKSGLDDLIDEYKQGFVFNIIFVSIRVALYVILGILALNTVWASNQISKTLSFVLYPIFIFFLVMLAYGLKDFASNFFAGLFIKNSKQFQIGQKIKYNSKIGAIEKISHNAVFIQNDEEHSIYIPNKEFIHNVIELKNVETDIPTLTEIKKNYVAQTQSYCGPATAAMLLDIFGYKFTQEEIGTAAGTEVGRGAHPEKLIRAIEKLTNNNILGVWIDIDNISDLREEVLSWMDDGALIIIDYKKNVLFPESKGAHYSAVLGVEGSEFIVLDPSSIKGGVFLANYKKIEHGMNTYSELIKGKRGYIVLAPRDSRAYNRIERDLIYSNINLYNRISRSMHKEFNEFVKKGQIIEKILPEKVKNYIEKFKNREKISRVWRPIPRKRTINKN